MQTIDISLFFRYESSCTVGTTDSEKKFYFELLSNSYEMVKTLSNKQEKNISHSENKSSKNITNCINIPSDSSGNVTNCISISSDSSDDEITFHEKHTPVKNISNHIESLSPSLSFVSSQSNLMPKNYRENTSNTSISSRLQSSGILLPKKLVISIPKLTDEEINLSRYGGSCHSETSDMRSGGQVPQVNGDSIIKSVIAVSKPSLQLKPSKTGTVKARFVSGKTATAPQQRSSK